MKTVLALVRLAFSAAIFTTMTIPFGVATPHFPAETPEPECLPKYPPPPVVKIMVRVPACTEPGTAIKYLICVENCSPSEAHHVTVKNAVPENAKFVKSDPPPVKPGPELQWNLGTVGAGARREIVLWLQPTNKEDVKNCARVQFEHGQCVTTRQVALPPVTPGERPPKIDTIPDVPPEGAPILDLQVHGPKEQFANLPAKYNIVLTNKGKTKATTLQVNARLSDKLRVVKVSEPGVAAENVVAWNLGTLEPGATRTLELTLKSLEKGEHCFKVIAIADLGVRKEVEMCTKFAGASAMTLEMFDREDPVFLGHKTSYPVTIRNQGSEPLTNIRLRAYVPNSLKIEKSTPQIEKQQPVQGGMLIEFKELPKLDVGTQAKYEIFAEALQAGVTIFRIEVTSDQLEAGRWVIEEESTTIVDDRKK